MFGHVYGKGVEAKLNLKREQVQGCERGVVYGKHTLRRSAAHAAPQYAAPPPRRTTTLGEHRCTVGTLPNYFELFLFNRLTFICHYHFYHLRVFVVDSSRFAVLNLLLLQVQ
jgi:hypothetical protein